MGFRLIDDGDGHWYVIPADKEEAFNNYINALAAYWIFPGDGHDKEPDRPEWLISVNGDPGRVVFASYEIR